MEAGLLSSFFAAFVTLFIVIDPIMVAPLFAALTHSDTPKVRRGIAIQATLIAAAVLLTFGFVGVPMLHHLGIDLAAFRAAGGILLFLIGFRMFFEPDQELEAKRPGPKASARDNIAFFPLALPMLAGPGAIATIMLLMGEGAHGDDPAAEAARNAAGTAPVMFSVDRLIEQGVVIAAMLLCLAIGILVMMSASRIAGALGRTGINAVSRLLGMILMALAVQYVFDGIRVGMLERVTLPTVATAE